MHVEVQALNFKLRPELRSFVERRLGFALGRHGDRLQQVTVRLSDVNGPRGGQDKRCLIQIRIPGQPDLVIDSTEENFRVAVHRAVDRAGWSLARKLQRQRNRNRCYSRPGSWRHRLKRSIYANPEFNNPGVEI